MNNNPISITLNGYDTCFIESYDETGKFLLISIPKNANKDIANICNTFVNGHLIKLVDYQKIGNEVSFIKAYY